MRKLLDTVLIIIIVVAVAFGAIYGYLHNANIKNLYDKQLKKIVQEYDSTSGDNAISTLAFNNFATAQADEPQNKYYIQIPLASTGRHIFVGLEGVGTDFLSMPMRTQWFKPQDNLIDCDIELQFFFSNETDNFILVVPSQISARTYLYSKTTIEFSFVDNYEFILTEKQYNLLQSKPYYQVMLRDNHVACKVQCDGKGPHGELVTFTGGSTKEPRFVKYFDPVYTLTAVAVTDNPTPPKGEIIDPTDPGGHYPVVIPPEKEVQNKINELLAKLFNVDVATLLIIFKYVKYLFIGIVSITCLSLFAKWAKFVFGKR